MAQNALNALNALNAQNARHALNARTSDGCSFVTSPDKMKGLVVDYTAHGGVAVC
jgi:hypothetical protein